MRKVTRVIITIGIIIIVCVSAIVIGVAVYEYKMRVLSYENLQGTWQLKSQKVNDKYVYRLNTPTYIWGGPVPPLEYLVFNEYKKLIYRHDSNRNNRFDGDESTTYTYWIDSERIFFNSPLIYVSASVNRRYGSLYLYFEDTNGNTYMYGYDKIR